MPSLAFFSESTNLLECVNVWNYQRQEKKEKRKEKKEFVTWRKENIKARHTEEHKFWTNLWVSYSQSSQPYILSGFRKLVMISKM